MMAHAPQTAAIAFGISILASAETLADALNRLRTARGMLLGDMIAMAGAANHGSFSSLIANESLLSPTNQRFIGNLERNLDLPMNSLRDLVAPTIKNQLASLPHSLFLVFRKVMRVTGLCRPDTAKQIGVNWHQLHSWNARGGFRFKGAREILAKIEPLALLESGTLTCLWDKEIGEAAFIDNLPPGFWHAFDELRVPCGLSVEGIASAIDFTSSVFSRHRRNDTLPVEIEEIATQLERLFLVPYGTLVTRIPNSGDKRERGRAVVRANAPKIQALIAYGLERRTIDGNAPRTIDNDASSLKGFIAFHGADVESSVSPILDAGFPGCLEAYLDHFQRTRKPSKSSLATLRSRLTAWHRDTRAFQNTADLPDDFNAAFRVAFNRSGLLYREVENLTGTKDSTWGSWLAGKIPGRRMFERIPHFEDAFGLTRGALTSKLGMIARQPFNERHSTPWAMRTAKLRKKPYALKTLPAHVEPQWKAFFLSKTLTYIRAKKTNPYISDFTNKRRPSRWTKRKSGKFETADMVHTLICKYFGFMLLPADADDPQVRGMGRTIESLSLADLIDHETFAGFLDFKKARSEGLGGDINNYFGIAHMLTHPAWGFLRTHHQLFTSGDTAVWKGHCDEAWETFTDLDAHLAATKQITVLRSPDVPLQGILDRERPIVALVELCTKMAADKPPATWVPEKQAIYWRDLTLVSMLVANPLRIGNYARLTYRPHDPYDPGHIRRYANGEWWLHLMPEDFKNERGAAREPYIVRISPQLWPLLEAYANDWRPLLFGADTSDRFFLAGRFVNGGRRGSPRNEQTGVLTGHSMFYIVQRATRHYIQGSHGFGPHAFRHIIATDYLKTHPNGHVTAAAILHDTVETVMEQYAHLKVSDTHERYNEHLAQAFGPEIDL